PSESTRQSPASFQRSAGNVLFWNCDQDREHFDADGGEQLGDGSYRHLLGAVGLPNSQYRTVDCFWPGVGCLGQGKGFWVGFCVVFVELAFVWIVFEPHAPHPGTL